jgi:hypothetical protein
MSVSIMLIFGEICALRDRGSEVGDSTWKFRSVAQDAVQIAGKVEGTGPDPIRGRVHAEAARVATKVIHAFASNSQFQTTFLTTGP